mmetsp:Transcript_24987/g.62764  ORF Transcript_24987/g.62764 Transcript_24987/m.62764 type:complete len:185 (-) Transcript_24987:48-602(-)
MDVRSTEAMDGAFSSWFGNLSYMESFLWGAVVVVVMLSVRNLFRTSRGVDTNNNEPLPPRYEPLVKRDYTLEELAQYRGISPPNRRIFLAARGVIYDVSQGRSFYGPGAPYHLFTGTDASRALALTSTDPKDVSSDISDLSGDELETLDNWISLFKSKYPVVGNVITSESAVAASPQDEEASSE